MPLVKAVCTNCGGSLEVDSSQKAAICPHCKQAYIVEEAINNYVTHIEHLHAENVTINDDRTAAARLEAGEADLKLKHWPEAEKVFKEVCDLTPQDYRGWWGRIRAITQEFTADLFHGDEIATLNDLFNSVSTFLDGPENTGITQTFNSYIGRVTEINSKIQDTLNSRIEELRSQIKGLKEETDKLENTIRKNSDWPLEAGYFLGKTLPYGIIIGIALSLFGLPVGFLLIGLSLATYLIAFIHNIVVRNLRRRAADEKDSVNRSIGSAYSELKKYENAHEILLDSTTYFPKEKKDEASKVLDDVLVLSGK